MSRSRWAAASAFALVLALGACGADEGSEGEASPTSASASPSGATGGLSPSPTASTPLAQTLKTAESDLGTILVDKDGVTVYLFTDDTRGSGESTCSGDCLEAWPLLPGAAPGEGVEADLVGTITRDDGTEQATYNGWPLYYYVDDDEPGDTTGQGVGGNWWVVGPDGEAIEE